MALRDERQTNYQQRIWKVSRALDRLALMCEQHRLQTKHMESIPDWTIPSAPAGVSTGEHVEPPAYFAWTTDSQEGVKRESSKSLKAIDQLEPTIQMPLKVPWDADAEDVSSHGSEDAAPVASKPASVRSQVVHTTEEKKAVLGGAHDFVTRQARDALVSSTYDAGLTENKLTNVPRLSRRTHRSVNDESQQHEDMHGLFRRRRVHFADHGRSYRGMKQKDLTYHEALQVVAPFSHPSEANRTSSAHSTTYQENFCWPSRDAFAEMMDKVGGQTAGGESQYVNRRVFTTDEAIRVARESARQFLRGRCEDAIHVTTESKDSNTDAPDSPPAPMKPYTEEPKHACMPTLVTDTTSSMQQKVAESEVNVEISETSPKSSKIEVDAVAKVDQPKFVDASTQTTPSSRAIKKPRRIHIEDAPVEGIPELQHLQKPRHSLRRTRQFIPGKKVIDPTKKNIAEMASAGSGRQNSQTKNVRTARPVHSTRICNPVLTNARYPPEPPIFRSKTTYSRDFGSKPSSRPF